MRELITLLLLIVCVIMASGADAAQGQLSVAVTFAQDKLSLIHRPFSQRRGKHQGPAERHRDQSEHQQHGLPALSEVLRPRSLAEERLVVAEAGPIAGSPRVLT